MLVAIGQNVRPGQPLASFLSPQLFDARRALAEANSQARLAQQALVRDQSLYEDGIIAASRWQATQARATEAAAMARARRAELASAGVVSSGSGEEVQLVASHQASCQRSTPSRARAWKARHRCSESSIRMRWNWIF